MHDDPWACCRSQSAKTHNQRATTDVFQCSQDQAARETTANMASKLQLIQRSFSGILLLVSPQHCAMSRKGVVL